MSNWLRSMVQGLAMLALLAGCQTAPKQPAGEAVPQSPWRTDTQPFLQSTQNLQALSDWRFSGKAAIRTSQGSDQINIDWSFSDQAHDIRLFGPLGMGAVKVQYDHYGVQMSDSKGLIYSGSDPDGLLFDVTGLRLPLSSLQYWLFALPEPQTAFKYRVISSSPTDRQIVLNQHGWEIIFSDFIAWPIPNRNEPWPLPNKISARGLDANGEPARIKLVAKAWDLAPDR